MPRPSLTVLLAALLLAAPTLAQTPNDGQIQTDTQHQLNKKQFRDIHVEVANGEVTLTGTVNLLADKLDAVKRVDKMHETAAIHDGITVNAADVSDAQLYAKLGRGLAFLREGYASFPFNSILLQVQNGVATIGGQVVEPIDKDDAISLVANTPGVRGLVDHLKVAPLSPNDWAIRRAEYNAVYNTNVSTKYKIDPAQPIRIVVENGHVILTGQVLNKGDRDIIGQRANSVPGVFSP